MAQDYVPANDGEFLAWEQNFLTYAAANLAALGLVAGDLTAATALQSDWEQAWVDHQTKQAAAEAATQVKKDKRRDFEAEMRSLARRLQASPTVDDGERQSLGLPVRDGTRTPVPAPTTRPVIQIDISELYRMLISFADEGTPTKKAKPLGVVACLLQFCISETMPTSDEQWQLLAIDTHTPYLAQFESGQAGLRVWIRGCWLSTRQDRGPWSQAVSAKVPG